ncbi:class I mannose-6-phosphate isomerase [Vagococcus sp. BWB3-3]|uniref:Class I mannose-6-phosphate isomerase n=1 Tax=Vagococcus allomyrinae TaxID=2794353 RepID=A0A940P9F5_9ENTE|nr:class I mannose-6-phosphate isomerase [Vagococcus allomyrinae]
MVYDLLPEIKISTKEAVYSGLKEIVPLLRQRLMAETLNVITIESYPLVEPEVLRNALLDQLGLDLIVESDAFFFDSQKVTEMIADNLTDDRVFGRMSHHSLVDFVDPVKQSAVHDQIAVAIKAGQRVGIVGVGASLIYPTDLLIYADLPRWEIQTRYRSGNYSNWQADNAGEDPLRMIKRGYFFEWRVADKQKRALYPQVDYFLDTLQTDWVMVGATTYDLALQEVARQPFSLVPFFDPGVWGGHWMQQQFNFRQDEVNLAWSFNGVPEENSLILNFGSAKMEIPGNNLVYFQGEAVLGPRVYGRFGANFPIRFNFLDTVGGSNLSLQVHPTTEYAQEVFGATYTQDESYYILHAEADAKVYLGVKQGVTKPALMAALEQAALEGGFPDEDFIYQQPVKKHDHFSIPGGTIHSSGANSVVLEISATPNRYTFKLWDWGRVDLDGLPRPVHLNHGEPNIDIRRDEEWVKRELVNPFAVVASGDGWLEERTGLHETEFIETRRHTFSVPVNHENHGSVNVLNLVEGQEALVESLDGSFAPFILHYAQTVIIPESVRSYRISPSGVSLGQQLKTMKAYVR